MQQKAEASAHAAASVRPVRQKTMTAEGRVQMVIRATHIPRCPKCLAANPQAKDECPACGEPAPLHREVREEAAIDIDHSILTWRARLFLRLGKFFTDLSKP